MCTGQTVTISLMQKLVSLLQATQGRWGGGVRTGPDATPPTTHCRFGGPYSGKVSKKRRHNPCPQPSAVTNRQPLPTTANRRLPHSSHPKNGHQSPTTNRRQPPPTATIRQSPTANRQSPPTMVEHMSYTQSFCKTAGQTTLFSSPLKDPPCVRLCDCVTALTHSSKWACGKCARHQLGVW